jgi:hypothetical protein
VQPPPNGYGPWSWYGNTDFGADPGNLTADMHVFGPFFLPALPFRWRPFVYGRAEAGSSAAGTEIAAYVRLGSPTGVTVASGVGARYTGSVVQLRALIPTYGDTGTKPLSPSSGYATVPANEEAILYMTVEREAGSGGYSVYANASLIVWAIPVQEQGGRG